MSRTKVIAFANNKGGSGKTTTCSNVALAMAKSGKRVLMIDGDMQLNLTLSFFDEEKALGFATNEKNIHSAVKGEKDLSDYVVSTEYENLDIVPSSSLMSSIEYDLFTKWQREFILRKCLAPILARGYYALYQKCVANAMKRRLSDLSSSTAHVTLFSAPMLTWKKSRPESSSARRSFL